MGMEQSTEGKDLRKEKWDRCVAFHGHHCPGLAIGFRAAEIAMEALGETIRAEDEEIVCVTENDACGVDAVQVLTGCTAGKGNLLHRETGKMAFSFFLRNSGKKVRVFFRGKHDGEKTREEWEKYILDGPGEELFSIGEPTFGLPEPARLFENRTCEICGEAAPEHKVRFQEGRIVCMDCFRPYSRGWQ